MRTLILLVLVAIVFVVGCEKKEKSVTFKGPSGETTSVTVK